MKEVPGEKSPTPLRNWCSGNIPSFQVGVTGSNPVFRFRETESPETLRSINTSPFVIILQKVTTEPCRGSFHLWVIIPQVKITR